MTRGCKVVNWTAPVYGDSNGARNGARESASSIAREICERISPVTYLQLTDPKQMLTDLEKAKYSRGDGYKTVHIHNMDIKQDVKGIAHAIAEVAKKREEDLDIIAGIK